MKVTQYINRGFNLLVVTILSLTGIAFMSEIFLEKDWSDKADDIGLLVLAVIAVIWYLTKDRKYTRSVVPVVLVILALLDKIGGLIIERKDADAIGDDIGGLILFVAATIIIVFQYYQTKKLLQAEQGQS